jgi:SAM-dependent methyltransferase
MAVGLRVRCKESRPDASAVGATRRFEKAIASRRLGGEELSAVRGCGMPDRRQLVVGLDISPAMIAHARSLNQFPERVTYVTSPGPELSPIQGSRFDFIVTRLTLQHIVPDLSAQYVSALCRLLGVGGILVFQLPSHEREPPEVLPAQPRLMPDDAYRAAIAFQGVLDGVLELRCVTACLSARTRA